MGTQKSRTYTGIFYPGEEPEPLRPLITHLQMVRIPAIISPIHSSDGETAKAHVHFMVDYPSPVVLSTPRKDFEAVAANGYLEQVRDRKHMMRYMLHLDDPDKEQDLDPANVICICGALFDTTIGLTPDDILRILIEIENYCDDNGIVEYSTLDRIVRASGNVDWFRVLQSKTIHLSAYFRSLRHREDSKKPNPGNSPA